MFTVDVLKGRVEAVRRDMEAAGRADATLVAVTKTVPPERVNLLAECGVMDIGENRVQEYTAKAEKLYSEFRFHHIGQLQSNKIKYIIRNVFLIQSVDRLTLLDELDGQAARLDKVQEILLQVNLFEEPQKGGVAPQYLDELLSAALGKEHLRVRGLMGIAPDKGPDTARAFFKGMREMFDALNGRTRMDILSMGMSGDYRIALEEGSTMLRLGGVLFG